MGVSSSFMGMPVPQVLEPGTQWAVDLTASFAVVDAHDHTPGHGAPVTATIDGGSFILATSSTLSRPIADHLANVHYLSDFTALSGAIAAANASGKTLVIDATAHVSAALGTVSGSVRWEGSGRLVFDTSGSISLSGSQYGGLAQRFQLGTASDFSGLTSVGAVPEVYPQWWGAKGDGVTDDTAAWAAALAVGANVYARTGIYLVDPLSIPQGMRGQMIRGDGFYHYSADQSTVLKARTAGQAHVLSLANGADNVTIRGIRIECDSKAAKGVDGTFGAFFTFDRCGVYNYTGHGLYLKQGKATIRDVFGSTDAAGAIGLHLYSDSVVEASEFTKGAVPILIVAGGNSLTDVFANTGTDAQVRLAPFDASTTLINTRISNLYAGETYSGAVSAPIIDIAGTASQRVQQTMISNSHLVHAEAANHHINGMIRIDRADDVVVSGGTMRGQGTGAIADRYTDYAVKATNVTNLSLSGGLVMKGITKNPINLGASCFAVTVNGILISEWATALAAGTEGAAILVSDVNDYGNINGVTFDTASSSAVPYAMEGGSVTRFGFSNNFLRYNIASGSTPTSIWNAASGTVAGGFQILGSNPRAVGVLAGFATYDPPNLADGAGTTTTITVTGAALGDIAVPSFSLDTQGITVTAWVSSANTVSVRFQNESGGALDLASGTLRARVQKL